MSIRKVPGSNVGLGTGCPDLSSVPPFAPRQMQT
jgi:hypothetical protein